MTRIRRPHCNPPQSFGWLMAAELRALGIDMSFTPFVERDLGLRR